MPKNSLALHPQRRNDIQGVRVIGALLVFSFHVFFSGVSGGVDVFFVVTGYFMAANAVRRGELTKPSSLLSFYCNFLLRVAPQAIVALLGVLLLLFFFVSPMVWGTNLKDVGASALYLENMRLISRGQDYLARSEALTLAQHFWAVSLIGQTYFVWPFVIRLNRLIATQLGQDCKRALTVFVCVLSVVSFSWSLYFTETSPTSAYFDFFSRFWEFGCGVLLGLRIADTARIDPPYAAALSWLGLVLLLSCGFVIGSTLPFPGYASLWPVAAALLLIHYGSPQNRFNASWLLSRRRLSSLGEVSFGVYLWHWPLYVVYAKSINHPGSLPLMPGLGLLVLSIICAVLSKKAVEYCLSIRRISSSTVSVPLGFLSLLLFISSSSEYAYQEITAKGRSWDDASRRRADFVAPGPFSVRNDNASVYKIGCHQNVTSAKVKTCNFGKSDASKKIVVVGGSHSAQWLPALELHTDKEDWQIISMTKSGCLFGDPADKAIFGTLHTSCEKWNVDVMQKILDIKPDLVISIATRTSNSENGLIEYVPDSYRSRFEQLSAKGIRILAIRDNPWMRNDVPVCIYSPMIGEKNICGDNRSQVLNDLTYAEALKKLPSSVRIVDLTAYFCDSSRCWAVKDGVAIYRDSHHITATYAERVSPALRDAINETVKPYIGFRAIDK